MNGTYLCPPDYPACATKVNSYDYAIYNSNLRRWINRSALIGQNALLTFNGSVTSAYRRSYVYGQNASLMNAPITAGITMFPMLLQNGAVVDSEFEQTAVQRAKGTKGSIGVDGTYVYLAIMSNVTVTESAYVLQALGARDAINLDGGGTSAMYLGGSYGSTRSGSRTRSSSLSRKPSQPRVMREWIRNLRSVDFQCRRPRSGRSATDYRLTAHHCVADRHERKDPGASSGRRPVLSRPVSPTDPTDRVDDAVVRCEDKRAERRRHVDACVPALYELDDHPGNRPHEALCLGLDGVSSRARRHVRARRFDRGAGAAGVELELRPMQARPAHAHEVTTVGAERARSEDVRQSREGADFRSVPHREAVERLGRWSVRRKGTQQQPSFG